MENANLLIITQLNKRKYYFNFKTKPFKNSQKKQHARTNLNSD